MKHKLLLKTHLKTGLKYLCKTIKEDYESYKGSGKYWKCHLKKHGRKVSSELIYESDDLEEFSKVCLFHSYELDIVDSKEFANLVVEDGMDGGDRFAEMSSNRYKEVTDKISDALQKYTMNGRPKEHNDAIKEGRINMSEESKEARKKKIQDVYATGKHDHLSERYSNERKGSANPCARKVLIDNVEYGSIVEAMKALGKTRSSVTSRLNSTSERWKDWIRL